MAGPLRPAERPDPRGGHLPAPWCGWALTPPALLAAALLTGRRRGSRLLTAGVMLRAATG
ncbi:hypothetical protein [Deinococcus sp. GbtcB9]|uniref:hypothetical protein n=1 Tax=Deinococcus sp. GbtcB9 TaxID=2824754 RepID=UPI001C2FAE0F|nr:hypothetical protein [Deinococcus sp. GbtcB9]